MRYVCLKESVEFGIVVQREKKQKQGPRLVCMFKPHSHTVAYKIYSDFQERAKSRSSSSLYLIRRGIFVAFLM